MNTLKKLLLNVLWNGTIRAYSTPRKYVRPYRLQRLHLATSSYLYKGVGAHAPLLGRGRLKSTVISVISKIKLRIPK